MNIIKPATGVILKKIKRDKDYHSRQKQNNPSFKGGAASTAVSIITKADDPIMNIFAQNYGNIGSRIGKKLGKLATEDAGGRIATKLLKSSTRFSPEKGINSITPKSVFTSFLENLAFPFVTLPLYTGSWVLDKARKIPVSQDAPKMVKDGLTKLKKGAEKTYRKPLFRVPRKINELNDKTDILKGIKTKTESVVKKFAKEKGMDFDDVVKLLNSTDDTPVAKEAKEYVRESLYKVSNKFFDTHTGNFNTAHERPLNRLVTGLIPVGFLAADAYNLSVLCGDKKEVSEKEAKERTQQEVSRVFTTAFIQLLTLGSFSKLANTKEWFTPLTSAGTVLFSETNSRRRLGKPIFFLSKEKAKEYNRKKAANVTEPKKKEGFFSKFKFGKKQEIKPEEKQTIKPEVKQEKKPEVKVTQQKQIASTDLRNLYSSETSKSSVFTSFKAAEKNKTKADKKSDKKETKKEEPKKALINMSTFKKGVAILVAGGFVVSFMKNSSVMKNTGLMKQCRKVGDFFKKQYDKIAFRDFEISTTDYKRLIKTLEETGCKEIAEGHNLIKQKYGTEVAASSVIKMIKHSISSSGSKKAVDTATAKVKELSLSLSDDQMKFVSDALRTAIKKEKESIAEHKFENVAKKAIEIINNGRKNNRISIPEDQLKTFTDTVIESFSGALKENATKSYIQVETKAKPFIDIVIQPFKFILSAAALPFEKVVKPLCNLIASPVTKKAAAAAEGGPALTQTQKTINKVVTEIFGEKKAKSGKISQTIFANAMEQLQRQTSPYKKAVENLQRLKDCGGSKEAIQQAEEAVVKAQKKLARYVTDAVEKSFNGVSQSSGKNTDIAMMTKLASSTVTSAFLVADNYNMVMIKSDGEDKEGAKEKANERIIQRLSALFYQSMLINWFNSTFRSTYNSSLKGMVSVAAPNTLTTEILTRKSIGMPITKKSYEELYENEQKNENKKGFLGKYYKFMRLLTGKKPLKDRMPKGKEMQTEQKPKVNTEKQVMAFTNTDNKTTNLLEKFSKK